jgi:glucosamine--fructose-6-phosphate aminotransferase (isomerizing)
MTSTMAAEIAEIPAVLDRQHRTQHAVYAAFGEACAERRCPVMVTIARGSSEAAAAYGRCGVGLVARTLSVAFRPSLVSVYGAPPVVPNALVLAVSQSGASPDLLSAMDGLRGQGAVLAALVNRTDSPLAKAAQTVLPMLAGPERAVAAQKSCLSSMAALAGLAAGWGRNTALRRALGALPQATADALEADWSALTPMLAESRSVLVIARGPALAAAAEMALKIKELLGLHAEAIGSADAMHGPVAIGHRGLGVVALAPPDEGQASTLAAAAAFRARGATVAITGQDLPMAAAPHALLAPLVMLTSFYRAIEATACHQGLDPDAPFGLSKVTLTV